MRTVTHVLCPVNHSRGGYCLAVPDERRSTDGIALDRLQEWRKSIDDRLWGGVTTDYTRSLEGRVKAMEETLADVAREFRRATVQRNRRLKVWQQIVILGSAVVTAVAAIVSAVYVILG